ncbi:MAG: hypothetical protein SFU25_00275 [Candidatus Caenarcaniphilales bacterium]|nr:hypothetical protein [Candidatus Caenarcaniphilales bacterium]
MTFKIFKETANKKLKESKLSIFHHTIKPPTHLDFIKSQALALIYLTIHQALTEP